MNSDNRLFDYF